MKIYNSPKNWPSPPQGWQPHENWHPDPAWGPAPPGHEFWIDVPGTSSSPEPRGKTLTTTALVLAAVAIVLCWIPILNILSFFLGLAAVVMAVIALVGARRTGTSVQGMTIAALAIGGISLVGVIVTLSAYSSGTKENTNASAGLNTTQSATPFASPTPSTAPSPEATAAMDGSAAKPHPLGTSAVVGNEYQVAVLGVKLNATEEVVSNNMFNDPPEGTYVLVDLTVTYAGADEGTPWIDLSPTFVGTDARQYDAGSCGASLKNGAMHVPTLEKGGQASYQVCMDVPVGAIEGGKIFIQKSFSMNSKARTYWGLK
ncbi:DUF4190 domain-containing protein [Pseudarthrobacter sp.]|uniref:DUF4190 domain-containing protein n=1 Tax=Pseudarthrobacter sp. TaxID=1934409 RepID=UPI002FCC857E